MAPIERTDLGYRQARMGRFVNTSEASIVKVIENARLTTARCAGKDYAILFQHMSNASETTNVSKIFSVWRNSSRSDTHHTGVRHHGWLPTVPWRPQNNAWRFEHQDHHLTTPLVYKDQLHQPLVDLIHKPYKMIAFPVQMTDSLLPALGLK